MTIFGRYDRANQVNDKTIVRLMDGQTAYVANKVQINNGSPYIVAESPKGSVAVYVDKNWDEIRREKSEDKKYYYEMVWNEGCPLLVSAADVYNQEGKPDKDTFDFLAEGEAATFNMTSNDDLSVKCVSAIKYNELFEIRTLELTVGDKTKHTEQWIIKGAFGYGNKGLQLAKTLYEKLVKEKNLDPNQVQLIVNCNTGKDRSAALIMWIRLFEMLDKQELKLEQVTLTYLQNIAKEFENQTVTGGLVDHIGKTLPSYYANNIALQKAIDSVFNISQKSIQITL